MEKKKIAGAILEFFLTIATETPNIFIRRSLIYKNLRRTGYDKNKIYKGVYNFKRRGLIKDRDDNYFLTEKGKKWVQNGRFRYFKSLHKKWDKKWRIVIFDIPMELNNQRNLFRSKLKAFGFSMLQKSVFVLPYACEEELGYLCQKLNISDYVDIILADSVGYKTEEIKKYYNL